METNTERPTETVIVVIVVSVTAPFLVPHDVDDPFVDSFLVPYDVDVPFVVDVAFLVVHKVRAF